MGSNKLNVCENQIEIVLYSHAKLYSLKKTVPSERGGSARITDPIQT